MKTILLALILLAAWYHFYNIETAPPIGPGIKGGPSPYQTALAPNTFDFKGVTLTEKASFSLTAKVLSAEHYYFDRHSKLSSLDVVLGWQELSDEEVVSQIQFSQSERQYKWVSNSSTISNQEIQTSTANIHLIPATEAISKQLKQLKIGNIIYVNGLLVDVSNPSGWHWKTSLSRTDTGKHSSEILYLTELEIIE